MTRVVSLSARRSRCDAARTDLKMLVPQPVFAEIGMIGDATANLEALVVNSDLMPLLSRLETIKLITF